MCYLLNHLKQHINFTNQWCWSCRKTKRSLTTINPGFVYYISALQLLLVASLICLIITELSPSYKWEIKPICISVFGCVCICLYLFVFSVIVIKFSFPFCVCFKLCSCLINCLENGLYSCLLSVSKYQCTCTD